MTALTTEELESRYDLLCKASQPNSKMDVQLQAELAKLEKLIKHDLVELTHKGCPDNITDILKAFENELDRFRTFCEFPQLATKSVVGIGGGFSAGKSSFINKLIDQKCLVVEIDPTTSMPAYVLQGSEDSIKAINLHNCAIDLTQEQFSSLTHEEKEKYGSQVGLLLQSAFISLSDFQWENLAILDTPGYSKPEDSSWNERTDENLARSQLNSADYIIWVVPADNGTISEEDIQFLSSLDRSIPKLIVLSKADKKEPDDIMAITELIKTVTANRGISILDVIPYSRRKRSSYSLESVEKHLELWNKETHPILFAQNFKKLLLAYQSYTEEELRQVHFRLNKIQRILAMTDEDEIQDDANSLLTRVTQELSGLNELKEALQAFNHDFFTKLKAIGNLAGVPLPEPSALELTELKEIKLLDMVRKLREDQGLREPESDLFSGICNTSITPSVLDRLLRIKPRAPDLLNEKINIDSNNHLKISRLLRKTQENIELKTKIFSI